MTVIFNTSVLAGGSGLDQDQVFMVGEWGGSLMVSPRSYSSVYTGFPPLTLLINGLSSGLVDAEGHIHTCGQF